MTRSVDVPTVAIVGIHGYGASHVEHVLDLQAQSRVRLVGLVDPFAGPVVREGRVIAIEDLPAIYPDTETLLQSVDVDIVIIATPLHTHRSVAELALKAGADVLLEKPPVTTLADLRELIAIAHSADARVQVGFQSLGSLALPALAQAMNSGSLGELLSIATYGSWTRNRGYWSRAPWAGRRTLNGHPVVDGVLTNPFAHAVMTSLSIAGWDAPEAIESADMDLYRANDIEADDTSSFRLTPSKIGRKSFSGVLSGAFTLAGPREDPPYVVVHGTSGSARLNYVTDTLTLDRDGETTKHQFGRVDLLENLLAARLDGHPLLAPLEKTGGFVRFVEAVAHAPVRQVAPAHVLWQGEGPEAHPVIPGIDDLVRNTAIRGEMLRETTAHLPTKETH